MYFNKEYIFKGKHAVYVKELKEVLFERNVDILILAPIVGLAYNRQSTVDLTSQYANTETTKIFSDVMIKTSSKNLFNFRLCVLNSNEFTDEEKKDVAFKFYTGDDDLHKDLFNKAVKLYNSYVLGGVEVLYEDMLQNNNNYNGKPDDIKYQTELIKRVCEFISNYEDTALGISEITNDLI